MADDDCACGGDCVCEAEPAAEVLTWPHPVGLEREGWDTPPEAA